MTTNELADLHHWLETAQQDLFPCRSNGEIERLRQQLRQCATQVGLLRSAELTAAATRSRVVPIGGREERFAAFRAGVEDALESARAVQEPRPPAATRILGDLALLRSRLAATRTRETTSPARVQPAYAGVHIDPPRGEEPVPATEAPRPAPLCFKAVTNVAYGGWREMGRHDHFVQIYEQDGVLLRSLTEFVADGLWSSERVIVIATPAHRAQLQQRLRSFGVDVISSIVRRQLVLCDAEEALARFMVEGEPDGALFDTFVGGLVRQAAQDARGLRAFGEMVALLWTAGNRGGALRLEALWNALMRDAKFSLFCAYPAECFNDDPEGRALAGVCCAHTRVIPVGG